MKQAEPDAYELELEQDIQASLSAALDDLDKLELFAPPLAQPKRAPRVVPKIPRGMPPLPHGRLIPPLPVSRSSLVPRLIESLRPKPSAVKAREREPVAQEVKLAEPAASARPRRWRSVIRALLAFAVIAMAWWWAARSGAMLPR